MMFARPSFVNKSLLLSKVFKRKSNFSHSTNLNFNKGENAAVNSAAIQERWGYMLSSLLHPFRRHFSCPNRFHYDWMNPFIILMFTSLPTYVSEPSFFSFLCFVQQSENLHFTLSYNHHHIIMLMHANSK